MKDILILLYNNINVINMKAKYNLSKKNWFNFLLVGLFPSSALAQPALEIRENNQSKYQVTGSIKGLEEGEKVLAILLTPPSNQERRDSAYVKNGVFHLSGMVPGGPREYLIGFSRGMKELDIHEYRYFHLIMTNGDNVTVRCDSDIAKINHGELNDFIDIAGSPYTLSTRSLLSAWFFYDRTLIDLKKLARKIVDSVGFDGPLLTGVFESMNAIHKSFYTDVFTDYPNQLDPELSMAHLIFVTRVLEVSGHAPFLAERFKNLTDEEKVGFYGKKLGQYVALCVGHAMPEFTLPGADDKLIALKDVVKKSKVTLVNFWGTNSPLVKNAHDELRALYRIYHDAGLNIIAVSSDDYKEVWLEALEREKYPWYNVLDKKGQIVDTVYHEYGKNPDRLRNVTNVLLDDQGKIIAWDVEGVQLHWYLWKYLGK